MRFLILYGLLIIESISYSQENLIINGNCEEYSSCPEGLSFPLQTEYEITKCIGFNAPTVATSDFFNRCATDFTIDVPSNALGIQEPFSGDGYLGAAVFSVEDGLIDNINAWWWEYIQGSISKPLEFGKKYTFSCRISIAEFSSINVNEIGIYFSNDQVHIANVLPLESIIPQITFTDLIYKTDTLNWVNLTGEFTASGGEKYFTIGNFKNPLQTNYTRLIERDHDSLKNYLYFDDFNLILSSTETLTFPDVFTPNEDGINDYIDFAPFDGSDVQILNRWGNVVLIMNEQSNYKWYGKNFKGEDLSSGVYYYCIKNSEQPTEAIQGTIHLIRD